MRPLDRPHSGLPRGAPPSNWIGTHRGEGIFMVLQAYCTGQACFDKTWKSDDPPKPE